MTADISSDLVVVALSEEYLSDAECLAQHLSLPLVVVEDQPDSGLALQLGEQGLQLQPLGRKAPGATRVDFASGSVAHRRQYGGGAGQMIAKAVGLKGGNRPAILDATAGLGKDAFVLATLGCEMTLLERSPVIHALLQDGLQRAAEEESEALQEIIQRITLHQANSIDWMQQQAEQGERFPVVYLDPMFPHSDKSALVKKEMRAFRPVVGNDLDADQLLDAALVIAINRVVVKRPRKAPFLAEREPSYQLNGKSSRYDIYTLAKF